MIDCGICPRGAARSARLPVTQEIAGPNPVEGAAVARRGTQRRQSGQAQTLVFAGSTPACATGERASAGHRRAQLPVKQPARKAMQVQLLPGALSTWPVGLSVSGCQLLRLEGPVRFRHGLLDDQVAQRVDARRSERRAHSGIGSSTLPMVTYLLQARQVPNWLSYGRCARFDTGACNCGWASAQPGLISLDRRCATPGPATTGYANGKSGEVESLVTLQVRLLSRSLK